MHMIAALDHLVITTAQVDAIVHFYEALGFRALHTAKRCELHAGSFKINVHTKGHELSPHALQVQEGSADLCFEITADIEHCVQLLHAQGIAIELGPVARNGLRGAMQSVYLRDPDGNLVELCHYDG